MSSEPPIVLFPDNEKELCDVVRSESRIIPVAGASKPVLSRVDSTKLVSLRNMSGIIQYDPSEFTFTAWAGTPIEQVKSVLNEKGQYLPFAPVLGESGATLGGSVASGLSGSGRFRFGGIRDFLLGARYVDGSGNLINTGGKVVKNAAGFDVPKMMVGSMGRLGALVELTFKVFPAPESTTTVSLACASHMEAQERLVEAARSRWELDALDYRPNDSVLLMRLSGPRSANLELANAISKQWSAAAVSSEPEASAFWRSVRSFGWTDSKRTLAKVPITPGQIPSFLDSLESIQGVESHIASGGMCAWVAVDGEEDLRKLDSLLASDGRRGLVFRGERSCPWLGERLERRIDRDIKDAFDPGGKFPEF